MYNDKPWITLAPAERRITWHLPPVTVGQRSKSNNRAAVTARSELIRSLLLGMASGAAVSLIGELVWRMVAS